MVPENCLFIISAGCQHLLQSSLTQAQIWLFKHYGDLVRVMWSSGLNSKLKESLLSPFANSMQRRRNLVLMAVQISSKENGRNSGLFA